MLRSEVAAARRLEVGCDMVEPSVWAARHSTVAAVDDDEAPPSDALAARRIIYNTTRGLRV